MPRCGDGRGGEPRERGEGGEAKEAAADLVGPAWEEGAGQGLQRGGAGKGERRVCRHGWLLTVAAAAPPLVSVGEVRERAPES